MNQPLAEQGTGVPEPEGGEMASPPAPQAASHEPPVEDAAPPSSSPRRRSFAGRVAEHLSWTASQRRGLIVVLMVVLAVLVWRAVRDRAFIADPQPPQGSKASELASRLDPNTASWEELVALPQLGEKRAKAIVDYREQWKRWHPNEPAFAEPLDMVKVTGIGAAMSDNLSPYLTFPQAKITPTTRAATKPSRRK
jgi:hypothetical protein